MTVMRHGDTGGGGPHFDDLVVGKVFDSAPSMTITAGIAAAHQAIVGDRLHLVLDAELSGAVLGEPGHLAHPGLVCDIAIGQSTVVTQRVKANLFYRGLSFHRFPVIGDTLTTRTEVVGLKCNSAKPGRAPTGLAALRMTTVDQADRLVLDFYRCAMLPCSTDVGDTGHNDDLSGIGVGSAPAADPTRHWDADAFRRKMRDVLLHLDAKRAREISSRADYLKAAETGEDDRLETLHEEVEGLTQETAELFSEMLDVLQRHHAFLGQVADAMEK